jgi:hypothetical protein
LLLSRHSYRKSVYADSEWEYEDVPARTEAGHWEGRKYQHQKPHCKSTRIHTVSNLKVHKNENFFGFDFEFCTISMLAMSKYYDFAKKTF